MQVEVLISDALHSDLLQQATACELSPQRYIAELVECAIAERRLEAMHSIQPEDAQPARSGIYSLGV